MQSLYPATTLAKIRRLLAAQKINVEHRFEVPEPVTPDGLLAVCLLAPLWSAPAETVIAGIENVPLHVLQDMHKRCAEEDTTLEERLWVWKVLAACEIHPDMWIVEKQSARTWKASRPLFLVDVEHDVFTDSQATEYRQQVESSVEVQGYFRMCVASLPVLAGGFVERACMHILGKRCMKDDQASAHSDVNIYAAWINPDDVCGFGYFAASVRRNSALALLMDEHKICAEGKHLAGNGIVLFSSSSRGTSVIGNFDMTHRLAFIKHRGGPWASAAAVCAWLTGVTHVGMLVSEARVYRAIKLGYVVGDATGPSSAQLTENAQVVLAARGAIVNALQALRKKKGRVQESVDLLKACCDSDVDIFLTWSESMCDMSGTVRNYLTGDMYAPRCVHPIVVPTTTSGPPAVPKHVKVRTSCQVDNSSVADMFIPTLARQAEKNGFIRNQVLMM